MMSESDKLREARSEIGQLRADLERVTKERDAALEQTLNQANLASVAQVKLDRLHKEYSRELAETKAALEREKAARQTDLDECERLARELSETKAALDRIRHGLKQVRGNEYLGAFFHHVSSVLSEDK